MVEMVKQAFVWNINDRNRGCHVKKPSKEKAGVLSWSLNCWSCSGRCHLYPIATIDLPLLPTFIAVLFVLAWLQNVLQTDNCLLKAPQDTCHGDARLAATTCHCCLPFIYFIANRISPTDKWRWVPKTSSGIQDKWKDSNIHLNDCSGYRVAACLVGSV